MPGPGLALALLRQLGVGKPAAVVLPQLVCGVVCGVLGAVYGVCGVCEVCGSVRCV